MLILRGFFFFLRLAEELYAERQLRLKRKSMEKGGRPFIETI